MVYVSRDTIAFAYRSKCECKIKISALDYDVPRNCLQV